MVPIVSVHLLLYSFTLILLSLRIPLYFLDWMFNRSSAFDLLNVNEGGILADDSCSYYDTDGFNQLSNSPTDFSIFYLNTRSLCKHFFDVQDYLCSLSSSFSVYGFTETWFKQTPPSYIHMNNFNLVHSSRCDRVGGGVALFLSFSMQFYHL